ncbi:pyridoxamine 5'-phosphate oxidase [Pacificimonas flava]|uniref:Pyridoxine/pyridoxamine 5'-phosphate oxidase n=2 Tax=Pacificimonas TaxID=1960290 RepID=A0A219B0T4_9SPHN|nr:MULTISPECIES: pyridoxamine 5'-phosphate oxidase [Pacificimonas]MBZ6379718.1 pyridoxamine 5'-phosphate oxidase [Pacificimonas aurantium]OWV31824.1 pyridoxamine 5'-phosphate oxidase [Pacificimonas flava]
MTSDSLPTDPFRLFDEWMREAEDGEPHDPNAMALATTGPSGPSVRMVLLKDVSEGGFVFYTNAESRKGEELKAGSKAALLFYWKSLRRQIRIEGPVTRVSEAESDAYFDSRPRASQIGAWASLQSRPLTERQELERRVDLIEREYEDAAVPRPPHWFGWRVTPRHFEFWIDRRDRLHERYTFDAAEEGWRRGMLYP